MSEEIKKETPKVEEIKKEKQVMELKQEELDKVAGGISDASLEYAP